ncbi:MAG: molybdopterin molybdenumtransferase MoeA, partial [Bdellovibrio sp.]|nr:molybdopterin molybdenumtransferase MoeA [Bdellovibrio sp.]
GCDVKYSGFVSDDPYEFKKIIHQILDTGIDIIITTGAVSMGKYDFVARSLEELGVKKHFHNVAIRPGKPLYFGEFSSGEVIFGVPGNPISTVVAFRFFVLPYIYSFLGLEREKPILAKNVLPFSKPHGFRCFYKAKVHFENAEVYVQILKHQASFMVSSLLEANAWAVIPEEKNKIDRDEKIEVIL